MRSMPAPRKTSSWSPWPISWRASQGCVIQRRRLQTKQQHGHSIIDQRGKDACGLEALTRSHFTALRRRFEITHQGLHENGKDERTVTTACLETCWTNWLMTTDRLIRTDTGATHPGQERCAPPKGRIHLRRLVFSPSAFSLQSDGGPYILVHDGGITSDLIRASVSGSLTGLPSAST
jgi:hypothetical protein